MYVLAGENMGKYAQMNTSVVVNGTTFYVCPYDHSDTMNGLFPSVKDLENHILQTHRKY